MQGIEVLDLGTLTPGKYGTFLLAELGASVLRVERPQVAHGAISDEDLVLNRGKRSMALNLREERGLEVLHRLVARADVVIESNRPGVVARLGIDYESLRKHNERLVYCALSGFGQEGPYRLRPAYDLTLMGTSGMLHALFGGRVPEAPPGAYLADGVSGVMAALAISVALLRRERDGTGSFIDLAMQDSVFSLLAPSHGLLRDPGPSAGSKATGWSSPLYAAYETSDGRQVVLSAIRPASCTALFRELGRAELAEFAESQEGAAEVGEFLRSAFRTASADEWVERLAKLDIEIGPVCSPAESFEDPQLRLRGMVLDEAHPQAGRIRVIGSPLLSRSGAHSGGPAPAIGEHTDEVLRELGYGPQLVSDLHGAGVVGPLALAAERTPR